MKFNLENLITEYSKLEQELSDPEIFKDQKRVKEASQKKKSLEEPLRLYNLYKQAYASLDEATKILYEENDEEMRELAKLQKDESEANIIELEEQLKLSLLPRDPNDEKDIIVEIRAWTGWEEAALFAAELSKAYMVFAQEEGFSVEVSEKTEADGGWVKEIIFDIKWEGAYSRFKYEAGTHRVQRIPETENKGRVHTSAITVAVLPEVEEIDIEINPADVEMQFTRSSWAGGQHVNKTDSAVHLKHIPTGIAVFCQDGRSQHKNREKAWQILRSKLYQFQEEKRAQELGEARLAQVGSGDRSEKIRTYNFPQDRVTDHRIGQNFSGIPQIMWGRLGHIIDALAVEDQKMQLEKASQA
jgi:peptide chain release factor 1